MDSAGMKLVSLIKETFRIFGIEVSRLKPRDAKERKWEMLDIDKEVVDGLDRGARKILNLLSYTKQNDTTYNAEDFQSAYHSIQLGGTQFHGQRKPGERLKTVDFDFSDTTVLDIGCNQGGMLFEISDQIQFGVGIDFDQKMVNAANRIRSYSETDNVNFFTFDLQREELDIVRNFLPCEKVSIVFLLSVCMWIKNWKEVICWVSTVSDNLLFESNGSLAQQNEQEEHLRATYTSVSLLQDTSPDDPHQKFRKLYLCRMRSSKNS
jgi:methyltransferase family protein